MSSILSFELTILHFWLSQLGLNGLHCILGVGQASCLDASDIAPPSYGASLRGSGWGCSNKTLQLKWGEPSVVRCWKSWPERLIFKSVGVVGSKLMMMCVLHKISLSTFFLPPWFLFLAFSRYQLLLRIGGAREISDWPINICGLGALSTSVAGGDSISAICL